MYVDAHHAISVVGHVALTYSLTPPDMAYLNRWVDLMPQMDPPILVLTVIDSGARAPDAAMKDAIRKTIKHHEKRIGALAYVVEGEGFGAAAMRSALSVINFAVRFPFPQRVTATVSEAAPWLIHQLPPALRPTTDAGRIVQTVDAIRAALCNKAG